MVAYSFQKQFADPILAGRKRQTLRNDRKRHTRPGETLQLYTGMRTKHCRLIGLATCERVEAITFDFARNRAVTNLGELSRWEELQRFAAGDGFGNWTELKAFWRKHHPDIGDTWSGVQITWGSSFRLPLGLASADHHTEGTSNV